MINLDSTPFRYWFGLLGGAAFLLFCEWHTDETGFMFGLLLVLAGGIGFLAPRHAILSALVIGAAIPLAHFLSQSTGYLIPHYQQHPPSTADWVVMTGLILVAGIAAQIGAFMRTRLL